MSVNGVDRAKGNRNTKIENCHRQWASHKDAEVIAAPLQNAGIDQGWMNTVVPSGWLVWRSKQKIIPGQHCSRFVPFCPASSTRHSRPATVGSSALLSSFARNPLALYISLRGISPSPSQQCAPPDRPVFLLPASNTYSHFFSRGLKGERVRGRIVTDCSVYFKRKGNGRLYYIKRIRHVLKLFRRGLITRCTREFT